MGMSGDFIPAIEEVTLVRIWQQDLSGSAANRTISDMKASCCHCEPRADFEYTFTVPCLKYRDDTSRPARKSCQPLRMQPSWHQQWCHPSLLPRALVRQH